ncbi:MAG TPA: hypothetical protein PLA94_21940, partial [Myxococcota bacterium]|nr:hypothetical protein [Myxococcota bacterium]
MLSFLMLAVAAPPSLESEIEDLPEPEVEETEARPVVGGVDTQGSRWPGIAAVFLGREVGCTGTLIAPRVVLT